jgi:hypothetical protein
MNGIKAEALIQFFQETHGVQFVDAETGKPIIELLRNTAKREPTQKSDYELWLEEQDELTQLEHKMGAF